MPTYSAQSLTANGKTFDQVAKLMGHSSYDAMSASAKKALISITERQLAEKAQEKTTSQTQNNKKETKNTQQSDPNVEYDQSPVMMGDQTLALYNGYYWLIDQNENTVRPFLSTKAFHDAYGDNAEAATLMAEQNILDNADFDVGGAFDGYEILGRDYAIKSDGTSIPYDNSAKSVSARYGNQINSDGELKAFMGLDRFVDLLSQETSGVKSATLEKLKNDKTKIAFYINALAYGGYTLADVYRDIRGQELGSSSSLKPISASQSRNAYAATDSGAAALSSSKTAPPSDLVGLTTEVMDLPIYSMPEEAYKTLVPLLDWESPEFLGKLDEVQSLHHDILQQQLAAETEQEKAIADANWEELRTEVERQFGIQLSNNAYEAWNQLESVRTQDSARGVNSSGIQAQSIDKYLRQVRLADSRERDVKVLKQEEGQKNFMQNYGTTEQIKAMVEEDKASGKPRDQWRSVRWGLLPSDTLLGELSFAKLKEKFPEMSDEDIQKKISSVVDENGNYRSSLYQNYTTKKQAEDQTFRQHQADTVYEREKLKEEEKYKQYTTPDFAFLRADGDPLNPNTNPVKLNLPNQFNRAAKKTVDPTQNVGDEAATTAVDPVTKAVTKKFSVTGPEGQTISLDLNQAQQDSLKAKGWSVGADGKILSPSEVAAAAGKSTAQSTPNQISKPTTAPTNGSIVDYLNSQGKSSDFATRSALASQYGISGYTGTADQNTQLLSKLSSAGSSAPASTPSTPSISTGGSSSGTYSLKDPSGKTIGSYSAADKASMEKMGLASGYSFSSSAPSTPVTTTPKTTSTTPTTNTAPKVTTPTSSSGGTTKVTATGVSGSLSLSSSQSALVKKNNPKLAKKLGIK